MDRRFDHRSQKTFSRDILFGTQLEKYFFEKWANVARDSDVFDLIKWKNNGCDNNGHYLPTGTNTSGADYMIWGNAIENGKPFLQLKEERLEVKWVPTAGKLTLKINDVRSYIREYSNILFIYNTVNDGVDLKKPKDYNLDTLIKRIESKTEHIKWGVLWSQNVVRLFKHVLENKLVKPIPYMGGKQGFIVKQEDYGKWWNEYSWR